MHYAMEGAGVISLLVSFMIHFALYKLNVTIFDLKLTSFFEGHLFLIASSVMVCAVIIHRMIYFSYKISELFDTYKSSDG